MHYYSPQRSPTTLQLTGSRDGRPDIRLDALLSLGAASGNGSVSNTVISPSPGTKHRPKVPMPPQPWPPLTSRVSPYSPALPSGVLIEAVKAGMSAQESVPGLPGGGGGKGKRKVVRVRG
ncbi:hypothetical protein NUW54_g1641 [Trametes sanguinea]|uniref:Uncharacterized protein n=1 Tax=Trametes sanguinea TaxID=158606 RepID=A0ACC1Q7N3_9APHY|nr:hypothetical protein NUW54_g1641 [Trametes sanguinea]